MATSAFFFVGRLDPAELANFNLQNLRLKRGGPILEVMGHGVGLWWPTAARKRFSDLLDDASGWLRTIASAYYLESGIALEPSLVSWVEALHVRSNEAMIGIADARFHKVKAPKIDDPRNEPMHRAVELAMRLRRASGEIERAAHEALAAGNDRTVGAFLSAYRGLECIRRVYEPDWNRRTKGWADMKADLAITGEVPPRLLREAAQAIRHGDVPGRGTMRHPVNKARRKRDALVDDASEWTRRAVERHT